MLKSGQMYPGLTSVSGSSMVHPAHVCVFLKLTVAHEKTLQNTDAQELLAVIGYMVGAEGGTHLSCPAMVGRICRMLPVISCRLCLRFLHGQTLG